ncbi:unnamed protein product [Didymodactylos carnosus]|uniref:Death domain-containing protein n=1 Tax=Didymodactylos carnosus TaxID=1234261 RepID=A0A815F2K0_9BILA|nr:unnamed protein product [Didymodactylos carnosus]CAF1317975.1 unnamed protein product [Didymodactylos carnosus]CAF3776896.1 unnamed protein product [Didymodactylos carnosus]CAF4161314.1 unnamed protein product [Didymodactylos carnosus]
MAPWHDTVSKHASLFLSPLTCILSHLLWSTSIYFNFYNSSVLAPKTDTYFTTDDNENTTTSSYKVNINVEIPDSERDDDSGVGSDDGNDFIEDDVGDDISEDRKEQQHPEDVNTMVVSKIPEITSHNLNFIHELPFGEQEIKRSFPPLQNITVKWDDQQPFESTSFSESSKFLLPDKSNLDRKQSHHIISASSNHLTISPSSSKVQLSEETSEISNNTPPEDLPKSLNIETTSTRNLNASQPEHNEEKKSNVTVHISANGASLIPDPDELQVNSAPPLSSGDTENPILPQQNISLNSHGLLQPFSSITNEQVQPSSTFRPVSPTNNHRDNTVSSHIFPTPGSMHDFAWLMLSNYGPACYTNGSTVTRQQPVDEREPVINRPMVDTELNQLGPMLDCTGDKPYRMAKELELSDINISSIKNHVESISNYAKLPLTMTEVLLCWQQKLASKATCHKLFYALIKVDEVEVARRLRDMVEKQLSC